MGLLTKDKPAKQVPDATKRSAISNDLSRWRGPSTKCEWDRLTPDEAADLAVLRDKCVARNGDEGGKKPKNAVRGILTSQLSKRERTKFERLVERVLVYEEGLFAKERAAEAQLAEEVKQRELERRAENAAPPRPILAKEGSVQFTPSIWTQMVELLSDRNDPASQRLSALSVEHVGVLIFIAAAFENGGSEHQVAGCEVRDKGSQLFLSKKNATWRYRVFEEDGKTMGRWRDVVKHLSANGWVRIIEDTGEGMLLERGPKLREGIGL
jgi:hypothetical protein